MLFAPARFCRSRGRPTQSSKVRSPSSLRSSKAARRNSRRTESSCTRSSMTSCCPGSTGSLPRSSSWQSTGVRPRTSNVSVSSMRSTTRCCKSTRMDCWSSTRIESKSSLSVATLRGKRSVVKTNVTLNDGTEGSRHYDLVNRTDQWLIFNVKVEGVSYVSNYRTELDCTDSVDEQSRSGHSGPRRGRGATGSR